MLPNMEAALNTPTQRLGRLQRESRWDKKLWVCALAVLCLIQRGVIVGRASTSVSRDEVLGACGESKGEYMLRSGWRFEKSGYVRAVKVDQNLIVLDDGSRYESDSVVAIFQGDKALLFSKYVRTKKGLSGFIYNLCIGGWDFWVTPLPSDPISGPVRHKAYDGRALAVDNAGSVFVPLKPCAVESLRIVHVELARPSYISPAAFHEAIFYGLREISGS